MLDEWAKRDPIERYQSFLLEKELLNEASLKQLEERINSEIDEAVAFAEASPEPEAHTAAEGVYAD
jgi:pyruvate dehydrogenase E1 component alpha subunit